ncbi:unnamed protein product [Callosobruchus maculatus]|uniref:Uncharacterized protein n=1 Tax=Callosobruchus maculatus TaxID=64391 RepID=A0A653CVZ5_CALMS|nr:unnamed protein product [Callosobruchus maculatus]
MVIQGRIDNFVKSNYLVVVKYLSNLAMVERKNLIGMRQRSYKI